MMNKILFSLLAIITIANSSYSQLKNPVKWKIGIESAEDGMYNIVYKATAEYGWTIYSQHTSDDGPVPTEIVYEDFAGISLEGDNIESGHKKEGQDPLFENVNVVKYLSDQAFVIKQKISVKDASIPVIGYLTYMTCDNKQCLPPTDVDFNLELPAVNSDNEADSKPMSITMGGDYVDDTDQSSGILNPVTWKWTKEKKSETQYKLVYTAAIQEGWTVYSQFTSDDGPVPTEVYY